MHLDFFFQKGKVSPKGTTGKKKKSTLEQVNCNKVNKPSQAGREEV